MQVRQFLLEFITVFRLVVLFSFVIVPVNLHQTMPCSWGWLLQQMVSCIAFFGKASHTNSFIPPRKVDFTLVLKILSAKTGLDESFKRILLESKSRTSPESIQKRFSGFFRIFYRWRETFWRGSQPSAFSNQQDISQPLSDSIHRPLHWIEKMCCHLDAWLWKALKLCFWYTLEQPRRQTYILLRRRMEERLAGSSQRWNRTSAYLCLC